MFITESGRLFGCGLNNKQQVGCTPLLHSKSGNSKSGGGGGSSSAADAGSSTTPLKESKLDRISVLVPRPIVASAVVSRSFAKSNSSRSSSNDIHFSFIKRASKSNLADVKEFVKFKSVTCGKNFTAAIAVGTKGSFGAAAGGGEGEGGGLLPKEQLLAWGAVGDIAQSANKRIEYLAALESSAIPHHVATKNSNSNSTSENSELKLDMHCNAVNISPALQQAGRSGGGDISGIAHASNEIYQIIGAGTTLGVLLQ